MVQQQRLNSTTIERLWREIQSGAAKPSGARAVLRDSTVPSLYVRTAKSGVTLFFYGWDAFAKRARSVTLGNYPTTESGFLEAARGQARQLSDKAAKRLPLVGPAGPVEAPKESMDALFARYFASAEFRTLKKHRAIEQTLKRDFLEYRPVGEPRFGERAWDSISKAQILAWRDAMDEGGKHRAKSCRSLGLLYGGISWLSADIGVIDGDKFPRIHRLTHKPDRGALPDAHFRALWIATAKIANRRDAATVRLLMLTGQRAATITGMRKSEITKDASGVFWFNVPVARSKGGFPYRVPLSDEARKIIGEFWHIEGDLLFPSVNGTPAILSNKLKRKVDSLMSMALGQHPGDWHFHDVRKNFRGYLDDGGVSPYVGEALIGHRVPHVTSSEKHYLVKSFDVEKVEAVGLVTERILRICEGSDVVFREYLQSTERPATIADFGGFACLESRSLP